MTDKVLHIFRCTGCTYSDAAVKRPVMCPSCGGPLEVVSVTPEVVGEYASLTRAERRALKKRAKP